MPSSWNQRLQKLRITKKQGRTLLKWVLYAAVLVVIVVVQGVILSRLPLFGAKVNLLPCYVMCVCIVEGADRGGVFALFASLVWALSGAQLGAVSILVLTLGGLAAGILMERLLRDNLVTCVLCCLAVTLVHESAILLLLLFLGQVTPFQYVRILLPGAAFSVVPCPAFYYLSRAITRVGGNLWNE